MNVLLFVITVLVLLQLTYGMGRLAKVHTDITYRMIERVIQGRLKYLQSGEEEDPFNNGRTIRLNEVSDRMRRALVEELRYTHEEIDYIEPQIAAVVLERGLSRPAGGMPVRWRRQRVVGSVKRPISPEPTQKKSPSVAASAKRQSRKSIKFPNLYELFLKKPIDLVLSAPRTVYKVVDNSATREAASKIYLIGRYAAPLILSAALVVRGKDTIQGMGFAVEEKSPEEFARLQAEKEAKEKALANAAALKASKKNSDANNAARLKAQAKNRKEQEELEAARLKEAAKKKAELEKAAARKQREDEAAALKQKQKDEAEAKALTKRRREDELVAMKVAAAAKEAALIKAKAAEEAASIKAMKEREARLQAEEKRKHNAELVVMKAKAAEEAAASKRAQEKAAKEADER